MFGLILKMLICTSVHIEFIIRWIRPGAIWAWEFVQSRTDKIEVNQVVWSTKPTLAQSKDLLEFFFSLFLIFAFKSAHRNNPTRCRCDFVWHSPSSFGNELTIFLFFFRNPRVVLTCIWSSIWVVFFC